MPLGPATLCVLLALTFLSAVPTAAQDDRDRSGVAEMVQSLSPEEQLFYDVLVKRPNANHRYGFGLGKRSPEPTPAQPSVAFLWQFIYNKLNHLWFLLFFMRLLQPETFITFALILNFKPIYLMKFP